MAGPATKRFILCFGSTTCFASLLEVTNRSGPLVPTFRSSYTISAITIYELRKAMGTSKFMILVPLFDLKSLGSFRRLRCRDFKSAALVPTFRSSYTISAITFYELRKAMGKGRCWLRTSVALPELGSPHRRCRSEPDRVEHLIHRARRLGAAGLAHDLGGNARHCHVVR